MVTFVYMGRFVNNLHCREDFWREESYREEFLSSLPLEGYLGETTYCFQLEACLARQAETLPQGQISENFSPMIIGLNASIFTPGLVFVKLRFTCLFTSN